MYQPDRKPSGPLRYYWYDAMDLPGGWDLKHVRDLILSRPMLSRVPDQSLVEDAFSGADHIRAARGDGYAFLYAPTGRTFNLRPGKFAETTVVAWWSDPAQRPSQTHRRVPGEPERGNDWVLVLDDQAKGYPAPGGGAAATVAIGGRAEPFVRATGGAVGWCESSEPLGAQESGAPPVR